MIRFYFILFFFLISLLAFLKAPEYHLWLLAIGVTEFPLLFFFITLGITLTGFWAHKYQMTGTILGVVTMLIFFSPIVRASLVAKSLKSEMSRSLSGIPNSASHVVFPDSARQPFNFWSLFNGTDTIAHKTLTYVKYQDTSITLDFFPAIVGDDDAALPIPRPCVIVVHGGSWAGGDSKQLPELNSYLAK